MAWRRTIFVDYAVTMIEAEDNLRIPVAYEPEYYSNLFSERGKILFGQKDYEGALKAYSMAIVYAYDQKFLAKMLGNRSMVYLKLEKYFSQKKL